MALCGSRYVDWAEDTTEIKVYSNQHSVTLRMDGKAVETQTGDKVFVFQVPITGAHTIEAAAGDQADSISIHKVSQPNPDYRYGTSGDVENWFDKLDESCYSIKDTFGALMGNPQTGAIVGKLMEQMIASRGDVARAANQNAGLQKMMAGMSFESLLKQAGDAIKPEQIRALNGMLQKIKK